MTSRPLAAVLLLIGACWSRDPQVPAGDVRAAVVHMEVSLDRALDAHARSHPEAAVEAWREAHRDWDQVLAPGLEPQIGRLEVVALELHLARIRAELERPDGDPGARVKAFEAALESPLRSLPPAPGG